ncbi:MAG: serine/threonine protein kinase [Planctomycetia bacterium]|nr:serine/threonine protein kinase [Planctomycetia bacterium]
MWNPLSTLFARSRNGRDGAQAHMTFGQTSIGRTISRTGLLLKKQLWIWPIIAVVLLAIVGYVVNRSIRETMERNLQSQLSTLLNVERAMLEKWFKVQESSALTLANDQEIRRMVAQLLTATNRSQLKHDPAVAGNAPDAAELHARLGKELEPSMSAHDFIGYVVADKQLRVVAASAPESIGQIIPQYENFLTRTLDGKPTVSAPYPSAGVVKDRHGRMQTGTPTMFACAPVLDENLQVVAVLALRIRPEEEFTDILQLGRIGETGETYAVNQDGLMVSNSRFDESLILLGLLPDDDTAVSILKIQVRDPGGNTLEGFRPGVRRRELPLTAICAAAVSGSTGVNMEGYRDYRGLLSVGAWTWLPEYRLGIITEIDYAEAYRPLTILQRTFYVLYALLGIGAVAIFVFTLIVARLQRQARRAEIEAKQIGQYRLLEKIGAGAMGEVYKGQHAMLRRPTAIKMLNIERVNEASIQRFEREVQITCKLNNPHTVAIYDYGRTPEGVFYYAMEYLDGLNLQTLVEQYGPQSEGRVASILRQICASLYEAHSSGLVHRDIKPANIMLNRRGAEPDVVKVLDFGLVKAMDDKNADRSSGNELSGTPLYMSPESIQTPESVDACSDLYAVGAVGYFLLTGETVFNARTLGELCQQHLTAIPNAPSQRLGKPISAELEHAILACLEKSRAKRPQTARDLATMLDRVTRSWSLNDAEEWWSRHERGQSPHKPTEVVRNTKDGDRPSNPEATPPDPTAPRADLGRESVESGFDRTAIFDADGKSSN